MDRTLDGLLEDWRRETSSTLKIFRALTDSSLGQRVTPDGRSLGLLAWHIVLAVGETGKKAGLTISLPPEDSPVPDNARAIVDAYEATAASIGNQIEEHWTGSSLEEEVHMFGQKWTRGFALASLLRHQTHHRGQMTVLMRQAGLRVPGVYGPAREEWARMGIPAKP
ncbi:MAG TPA: DinB family protein [Bacteroidota bacterium]|nr:DinB family protein [Bacteroidota bacterium]